MLKIRILDIVTDSEVATLGAKLDVNGAVKSATTADLIKLYNSNIQYEITNAVLDRNGHVRGKKGINLPRIIFRPNDVQHRDQVHANKILNETKEVLLYHGSKELNLVPKFGIGKPNNDYGRGFYTTPDKELGREWAYSGYSKGSGHYLYTYKINLNGLKILDFTKLSTTNWLAELMANRIVEDADSQMFLKHYKLDTRAYDIIIGYRADDSYFDLVKRFVNNKISYEQVERGIRAGNLGLQVFVKSQEAFNRLKSVSREDVDIKYLARYKKRDNQAREEFIRLTREDAIRGTLYTDILRRHL